MLLEFQEAAFQRYSQSLNAMEVFWINQNVLNFVSCGKKSFGNWSGEQNHNRRKLRLMRVICQTWCQ